MDNGKVNFSDASSIAQALKHQIRSGKFWNDLTPAAKEALDQIATSIGRTVSGDGVHWDAIIGFAQAAKGTDGVVEPAALKNDRSFDYPYTAPATPPTVDIERGIRHLIRDIPGRNDHA